MNLPHWVPAPPYKARQLKIRGPVTCITPGSYATPGTWAGAAPAINLTVNVNAGTVVGQNAAQALVNLVMPQMVAQLRQAGVKI